MTYAGGAAGGAAAAAAAAHKRRMNEEEERLTTYNKGDLEGWEFKIIRANTEYFKKFENVKRVCDEEARAGWEMVEKFDNNRIRFKRPIEKRKSDSLLQGVDPYRTQVGIGTGPMVAIVLGIIAAVIALAVIGVGLASRGH
jgi:hypothetical protein